SLYVYFKILFISSRSRHTSFSRDWSSDVCSSDLQIRLLICPNAKEHAVAEYATVEGRRGTICRHKKSERSDRMESAPMVARHLSLVIRMLPPQSTRHALRPVTDRIRFLRRDVLFGDYPQSLPIRTDNAIQQSRHRRLRMLSVTTSEIPSS